MSGTPSLPDVPSGARLSTLRRRLLDWYRAEQRDLPWRRTSDPYAIWVSEVMLQQTRVATVIPYYGRFLERFPDPAALAAADEEDVLAAWTGLGYYRRARGLQVGARAVVERHGGRVPSDPTELREIPGIGRYTAGAIASIAFGQAEPVLDGNVRRVLSRWFALDARGLSRTVEEDWLWDVAGRLARCDRPGDVNQALMELGALVCAARTPACDACPVRRSCAAFATGAPEDFPAARPRRATETVRVVAGWIVQRGRVLLERKREDGLFRGAWDLPGVELSAIGPAERSLSHDLNRRHRLALRTDEPVALVTHGILHRRLTIEVVPGSPAGRVRQSADLRWHDPAKLDESAVSGVTIKIARAVRAAAASAPAAARRASAARLRTARRTRPRTTRSRSG